MGAGTDGSRVRRATRSAVFVLGAGAVSWAWSEVGFWAHVRADDQAAVWLLTWLMYSLAAAVALRALRRWLGRDLPRLVLVGALYGWVVEGVVAATVYSAPPFTLVWTGVAWHGLLTVVVGWWALPRAVVRGDRRGWLAAGAVGVAWGLWSAGWWAAPPDAGQEAAVPDVVGYAAFVAVVCTVAALGYVVMHACAPRGPDLTSRAGLVVVIAVLAVWGVLVVLVAIPWAPALLAALVALVVLSLRRLGPSERCDDPPVLGFEPGIPVRRLAPFALVPVLAVATYAVLVPFAPEEAGTGPFFALIVTIIGVLSLAGTAALVWALWHAWRRPRAGTPGPTA